MNKIFDTTKENCDMKTPQSTIDVHEYNVLTLSSQSKASKVHVNIDF